MVYKVKGVENTNPYLTSDIDKAMSKMSYLRSCGDIAILSESRGRRWFTLSIWASDYSFEIIMDLGVIRRWNGTEFEYFVDQVGSLTHWTKYIGRAKTMNPAEGLKLIKELARDEG